MRECQSYAAFLRVSQTCTIVRGSSPIASLAISLLRYGHLLDRISHSPAGAGDMASVCEFDNVHVADGNLPNGTFL